MVKNSPASAGDVRCGFNPWVGKIPWNRKWQPTPVFLPEKFCGQRSLTGYSPWGREELDTTEQLSTHTHTHTHTLEHNYINILKVRGDKTDEKIVFVET